MAQPNSRAEFIAWVKRRLGAPVINIELDDAQCDDLVDSALNIWREYHYDATERTYLKHQVTQTDIDNKYIPCSDDIISVVRVVKTNESNINLFDIRYQLRLQDFYNFSNVSMQHYVITMDKLALLDWLLNPEPTIAFTRYTDKIHLNIDWVNKVKVGDFLVFEVYRAIPEPADAVPPDTPAITTKIFHDRWLQRYATAMFKQQWGANLKKFGGIQMLGGVTFSGQQLFDEATLELERLEEELHANYQPPPRIFLG